MGTVQTQARQEHPEGRLPCLPVLGDADSRLKEPHKRRVGFLSAIQPVPEFSHLLQRAFEPIRKHGLQTAMYPEIQGPRSFVGKRHKVLLEIKFLKAIALFDRSNYKGNWSSPAEETEKTREVIPEQIDDLDGAQRHLMKQGQRLTMGMSS